MSGWDASSRPSWDPQGGAAENTQSFGVPDFPEDGGGFPSSTSPGTPPAIFLQDYDQNEVVQDDFGKTDFGANGFGRDDYSRNDPPQNGFGGADYSRNEPPQSGFGRDDSRQNGFGPGGPPNGPSGYGGPGGPGQGDFDRDPGRNGFAADDFGWDDLGRDDFGPQDGARRGYGREEDFGHRGFSQGGPAPQDYSRPDYQRQDYPRQAPPRDQPTDYPAVGHLEADGDYAARMDPALRDFFAPQSARQDQAQPTFSPQRPVPRDFPGQGPGPGPGPGPTRGSGAPGAPVRPGGPPGPGSSGVQGAGPGLQSGPPGRGPANGYRPPSGLREAPPSRWDTSAPRPGSRSARRLETRTGRGGNGGRSMAGVIVAVVVVLGIAVGAYVLLRGKPAAPAAQNGPTSAPASSTHAAKSPSATPPGRTATTTRYTLKTPPPAKAGGYAKLASVPTAVQSAAGVTSAAIKDAAVKDGGKVASEVTAAYQLSGGQVLAFTGFTGTFNPAKVMASLATLGTDSHTAAAGRHGGMLACATAPGSPNGTVCMWVTTTTMGITEFFGSDGPEVVAKQSKAAADALKVRDDVEVSKS